jgi:hypothetical protein
MLGEVKKLCFSMLGKVTGLFQVSYLFKEIYLTC